MSQLAKTVVGIDVGGERKGFHSIAYVEKRMVGKLHTTEPDAIVQWCMDLGAQVVAVDSPCGWSLDGRSRRVEREMHREGIGSFFTATRGHASTVPFSRWVFNGERMYSALTPTYRLFDGHNTHGPSCIETFPHAVVCALFGRPIPAKNKSRVRRALLDSLGYDTAVLNNLDVVDAALCAVAADAFLERRFNAYGDALEGIIIVPSYTVGESSSESKPSADEE